MSDRPKRIFISVANREHAVLRATLRDVLSRAGFDVVVQPDFPHAVADTVRKLDDLIAPCDLVVHIVGHDPGTRAAPDAVADFFARTTRTAFLAHHPGAQSRLGDCGALTYVQWEPWLALHRKIDVLVYGVAGHDAKEFPQRGHLDALYLARKHADTFPDDATGCARVVADVCKHFGIVPPTAPPVQRIAKPRLIHHTAEFFLGREDELALLDCAWADGTHVLSVIAWGGVGKTALLSEWIQTRFIDKGWKDADGNPSPLAYFDWSFYDQGTRPSADEKAVRTGSVGDFFEQALGHLGDPDVTKPGKGARLAGLVRQLRMLFILDGLEPLQYPVGTQMDGRLLDPDLRDFITMLAQANPDLLVITSRQALTDLGGLSETAARSKDLDDLPRAVAVRLLRRLMIAGTDAELGEASEKFGRHALSLTLLGRFLFDAHPILADTADGKREKHGDIRRIDQVDLKEADDLTRGDRHRTAWKVLEAYESWLVQPGGNPKTLAVLRLTGLFDRTATAGCLAALRAEPVIPGLTDALMGMKAAEWNVLLGKLERAHLLKLNLEADGEQAVDAHPLIREFFALQLRLKRPPLWRRLLDRVLGRGTRPSAFKAAHSRLFDYLCAKTEYRPDTLDGLQPLYQAVVHGCLAGRHQEACEKVYDDRILRGTGDKGYYSTKQLGAFGAELAAVAAFFDEPWSRVTPTVTDDRQAWLFSAAAVTLRALGRLTEAVQPMRSGLEMRVRLQLWELAALSAGNLADLEVTLGLLAEAVADARQAVELADRSGDRSERTSKRTRVADALQQAGRRLEAGTWFAEAERIQEQVNPKFPLLHSQRGFRYCNWLLAPVERAAWRTLLRSPCGSVTGNPQEHAKVCDAVELRGKLMILWRKPDDSPCHIARDHLTLARVSLARRLIHGPDRQSQFDLPHVAEAINGFRRAGQVHQLPHGLLTAALYHFVRGEDDTARRYLDECQVIAERGPMPLVLADVHLHRARMFRDKAKLAKAARLIRDLGYGRRYDELSDAEAALG